MGKHSTGALLGAFLGGAIIGGALALLLAPQSGAETRKMIREYVDDEVDELKIKASQIKGSVEQQIDKYAAKARGTVEEIVEIAEDVKDCIKEERGKLAHK